MRSSSCPKCGGGRWTRSHRRNRFERALHWAGLRPWRCQDCDARFLHLERWRRNRLPKDHRRHERSWWGRLPAPTRIQVLGYASGIAATLAFLSWLVWGGAS